MDVSREPISQLTGVGSQVHVRLLELGNHGLSGALVSAKLTVLENKSLVFAAHYGPHQKIGNIMGNRLREGGEFGGTASND